MQNASLARHTSVAERMAQRALAERTAAYAEEVRLLLDAGLQVIRECGTTSRPKVADIVAAAGLSNDAFYRHFKSKDGLITALIEDGAEVLHGYLEHQMSKQPSAEGRIRVWVRGVMSQAEEEVAATTVAVLWNAGSVGNGPASGRHYASGPLALLLRDPLRELGSEHPEQDATLITHAMLGTLSDHLWRRTRPTAAELDHLVAFSCMTARGKIRSSPVEADVR
jgi:AcrR family transcriptional regulator